MNVEWDIPFSIVSPFGTLLINQDLDGIPGKQYRLNGQKCFGRRGIRATVDPIPQGDGDIFHERFAEGSELQLALQLWQATDQIACDDVLCEMYDQLRGVLWSLLRPADDGGRVIWTPSCGGQRMIDAALLLSLRDPEEDAVTGATELTAVIDTPFPYAISLAQAVTNISGAGSITNAGNVEFWPVIKVNGPAGVFSIENQTAGLEINWDASFGFGPSIGAGEYAEIDTFKGTVFLNGDGADLSNALNPLTSDFFPLVPGANSLFTTFADADFLTNDAFA